MHVRTFLHKLLKSSIHKSRITSLIPIVKAIIDSKQLKLTQLGRSLKTLGKERAGIRRVDRLLANPFYQEKNIDIYREIAHCVVGAKIRPIILVDWTGLPNSQRKTIGGEYCALRAVLAAEGRGITIYDEVHSKKKDSNPKVHANFLKNLKSILPPNCCPIIVTDAGFKIPWFKAVTSLGWDYVGRVRGVTYYANNASNEGFKLISMLFNTVSKVAKSLGEITLAKTNPFITNAFTYKHKLVGRKKITKGGKIAKDKDSKKHSRGYREPWILVSSLKDSILTAKKVVKIYKCRMTIEENIRDVKSVEYGLSMNENNTIKSQRYIVWLMLSALATLIAWVVGYCGEQQQLHYDFQANTERKKRVLSFFYLGCQIIRKRIKIPNDLSNIQTHVWGVEI